MDVGQKVMVRTTGETVVVLAVDGNNVEVRRPVAGQNGIFHETAIFNTVELAEPLAYRMEEHQEMLDYQNAVQQKNPTKQLTN